MASATRTIRVRFDGSAKGLIAAATKAGIAVEGFEKQTQKSTANLAKSTSALGGGLVDALGSLPSVLKGAAIVAAVGIGAVMAPVLAGVLISGILLAVSGGVLAAGIIGAAKSPKVVKAWQKFGRQATVIFERFSKPFIAPLVRAAQTFSRALARAEPTIRRIGATLAPVIDKLAPAFAGLFENMLPGLLTAVQATLPLFDVLAANLPLIGTSLALFFETLARGVPSAQVFFDRFLKWAGDTLVKLAEFLVWLSDLGIKMEEFSKGPQFTGLVAALTSLKDDTLAGVKTGFDNIKISVDSNSETWRNLVKDIEGAIRILGPAVKWFADLVGTSIGAAIDWFASLYNGIRRVWTIVETLIRSLNRLPGNLSGNGTNVQFGNIPGRARGGGVGPHRSYLVGDGGEPEILTMGAKGGRVTPLSQAQAGGGDTYLDVSVYLSDQPVKALVKAEVRESNRGLKRSVLAGAGSR